MHITDNIHTNDTMYKALHRRAGVRLVAAAGTTGRRSRHVSFFEVNVHHVAMTDVGDASTLVDG